MTVLVQTDLDRKLGDFHTAGVAGIYLLDEIE
jgi:hypothetical protein